MDKKPTWLDGRIHHFETKRNEPDLSNYVTTWQLQKVILFFLCCIFMLILFIPLWVNLFK